MHQSIESPAPPHSRISGALAKLSRGIHATQLPRRLRDALSFTAFTCCIERGIHFWSAVSQRPEDTLVSGYFFFAPGRVACFHRFLESCSSHTAKKDISTLLKMLCKVRNHSNHSNEFKKAVTYLNNLIT